MFSIRGPNAMHVDASSRGATFNLVAACRLPRAQEGMPPAKKAKKAKKGGENDTNAPIATAAAADIMWQPDDTQSAPAADLLAALDGARCAVAKVTSSAVLPAAAAEATTAAAVTTDYDTAKGVAAGGVAAEPVTLNIAAAATAATVDDAAADATPAALPPCDESMLAAARPASPAPLAPIDTRRLQHVPSASSPAAPPASRELRAPQPLRTSKPKIRVGRAHQADVPALLPGSVPDDTVVPNDGGGGGGSEGSFGEGAGAAASMMKQGYRIVPNPPGFIANIGSAFDEAVTAGQRCAQLRPIGQLYPGPEFGRNPNTGDGKRLSADSTTGCKWGNLLHTMLQCIIAQYDLRKHILKLKGDELASFMETSMLESLPGVNVQGGHFDTERACGTFMQHGSSAPADGIVAISPIDGPSNVLILKEWASHIPPTAEEFAEHAKPIDIPANHTLLMSDHMPHAGGDMAGRRGHAIITKPDLVGRKLSEKKTFWLAPKQSRVA